LTVKPIAKVIRGACSGLFARLLHGRYHARPNSGVDKHESQPGKWRPIGRLLGGQSIRMVPLILAHIALSEGLAARSERYTAISATVDLLGVSIKAAVSHGVKNLRRTSGA